MIDCLHDNAVAIDRLRTERNELLLIVDDLIDMIGASRKWTPETAVEIGRAGIDLRDKWQHDAESELYEFRTKLLAWIEDHRDQLLGDLLDSISELASLGD